MKSEAAVLDAVRIYGEWNVYVDRQESDEWPDVRAKGCDRWLRPHKLTLGFRQRSGEGVRLLSVYASCQKRWLNSNRLTGLSTDYGCRIWEVNGPLPGWLIPITREALAWINPVDDPRDGSDYSRGFDKMNACIFDQAANFVGGLNLEGCGEDGHLVANKLWKISAYLRRRSMGTAA